MMIFLLRMRCICRVDIYTMRLESPTDHLSMNNSNCVTSTSHLEYIKLSRHHEYRHCTHVHSQEGFRDAPPQTERMTARPF